MAPANRDEALSERFAHLYGVLAEAIAEQIRRGIREQSFGPVNVESAAAALIAAMEGLLFQARVRPNLDLEAAWRETETLFIKGLQAR
jgi:hypothetical protein